MKDKARSRLMRWWRNLRSWEDEARRARAVLEFLQQEIVREVSDARSTWNGDGPDRKPRTAPKLARAAAMAIVAEQIAKIAAVGGDQVAVGWRWLDSHVQRATRGDASEAEAKQTRWRPHDVAWISERLEDEWRLQAWRCGDEAEPTALLRTPVGFNRGRDGDDAPGSWLHVHVLTGRALREAPSERLPDRVFLWDPCGPAARRRRVKRARDASVALRHLRFAAWGEQADVVRASQTPQRHAFRVREVLRNGLARVARAVRRAPGNTPAEQRRQIGEAADDGQLGAAIAALVCRPVDLTSGLVDDALRFFAELEDPEYDRKKVWMKGGEGDEDRWHRPYWLMVATVAARLAFWRAGRPTRSDPEDAALDRITGGFNYDWAVQALLLTAPRRFAGWLEQDALRLRSLSRVLHDSQRFGLQRPNNFRPDELSLFVQLGLAGMAWRAKVLSREDALQDPADVVGMLADDLVAPRIRAEAVVASPRPNARSIARRIVWGITFDEREGSIRWGALRRTCDQIHAAHVLAARDEILCAARDEIPRAFVAPEGWDALAPSRRSGVRHLADEAQVWREGEHMKHCVGSYVGKVLAGECHLFHLECGDRPATLEVIEDRGEGGAAVYRVAQLRGPRNAKPSAVLQKRARTFCDDLSAAARRLPGEDREAIRKQRTRQAATAWLEPRDPTPEERQRLWERVYGRRVPGAWKALAPDRKCPWRTWLARYASDGSAEPLRSLMTPAWVHAERAARRDAEQRAALTVRLLQVLKNGSDVPMARLLHVLRSRPSLTTDERSAARRQPPLTPAGRPHRMTDTER